MSKMEYNVSAYFSIYQTSFPRGCIGFLKVVMDLVWKKALG